ncbi:MAG: hypothetical protein ACK4YU_02175 [Paracoccus sp. (in: a-proteobacteria)]
MRITTALAACAVILLTAGGGAAASCEGVGANTHLVVLEAQDAASPLSRRRSGVLISRSGLILSVLNLEENGIGASGMLNTDPSALRVNVWSDRTPRDQAVAGVVFGYDAPRNLIAIKISDQDVARLGLDEIGFGRMSGNPPAKVCLAGFREFGGRMNVTTTGNITRLGDGGIHGILDHSAQHTQMGGAVLDPTDGGLLGVVMQSDGAVTQYLPIEYADTLISQVFIGRIMKEMDSLTSTSEEVQTAVGWSHHITRNDRSLGTLQIRFFFEQYASNLIVDVVRISTELTGTDRDGNQGAKVLGTPDEARDDIVVDGKNYVQYIADRHFTRAANQGFRSIDTIRISLIAQFRAQDGAGHVLRSRTAVFELPIDIIPRVQ